MTRLFYSSIIIFLLCFVSLAANTKGNKQDSSKKYKCTLISRSDAINRARSRVQGKIVGVKLKEKGARSIYRVRVLVDKKRIKTISIQGCR